MRTGSWSRVVAAGVLALAAAAAAHAQEAPKGPLSALVRRIAQKGALKPAGKPAARDAGVTGEKKPTPTAPAAAKFKPSGGHLILDDLVNELAESDEQKDALRQIFTQGIGAVEAELKKEGRANDVSAALAMFVAIHWSAATEKVVSDAAGDALLAQFDGMLDSPELRDASDADKQRFYEYCTFLTVFTSVTVETAEGEEGKKLARQLATKVFQTLLPVNPERVKITAERGLEVPDAAPAEASEGAATPPPGASGLKLAAPAGWAKESEEAAGATFTRSVQTTDGGLTVTALLLTGAARAGAPESLASRWFDELVRPRLPADGPIPSDARPEVFRRYVGNGLRCAFVTVAYDKKAASTDYSGTKQELHLYAVESGGEVVPILFALSGMDGMGSDGKYVNPDVRNGWVEEALGALSGAATGKPLYSAAELAGAYTLTSHSMGPQYYNIYTGASTGHAFTSRGNTITLQANGTFEAKYVGTSGVGSIDRVYSESGRGRFRLTRMDSGVLLVMTDAKTGREFIERLAGAFTLPGGAGKVMVTLPDNMLVSAANISASADRYVTKLPAK